MDQLPDEIVDHTVHSITQIVEFGSRLVSMKGSTLVAIDATEEGQCVGIARLDSVPPDWTRIHLKLCPSAAERSRSCSTGGATI